MCGIATSIAWLRRADTKLLASAEHSREAVVSERYFDDLAIERVGLPGHQLGDDRALCDCAARCGDYFRFSIGTNGRSP
jgi:hypothetical protein